MNSIPVFILGDLTITFDGMIFITLALLSLTLIICITILGHKRKYNVSKFEKFNKDDKLLVEVDFDDSMDASDRLFIKHKVVEWSNLPSENILIIDSKLNTNIKIFKNMEENKNVN